MRSFLLAATAVFIAGAGPTFAQGPEAAPAAADQARQVAVDTEYVGRCEAKAPKELCGCVVRVADSQFGDPDERAIFYNFMMGDVEKAHTGRDGLDAKQKSQFNVALQKADLLLGEQCDRLKPKAPETPQQPAQKMP
ncbi:hypothetical protein [Methylopila sp. M107]|uniref:hypothetical protein n=1 Tax=Methylopila sp. M107 TaxID=1101190 RepID=UPI000377FBB7|nr:hypothetical protein [Methylopila sp. M107]